MAAIDKSGKIKVFLGGGEKKEQHIPNPKSQDGVPDLCALTYLGEGNVVHNLECRYKKTDVRQRCYTSMTAKVLVAVNPYERQDDNYTEEVMRAYQARPMNLEGLVGLDDIAPHVYTCANSAYLNMVARRVNQSIIVCGESGSGKTESAKYMMRYLAFTTTSTSLDPTEFAEADAIGQQVLDANPILESFGNAKTLINNNSSRFGKFTKMLFADGKVAPGKKPRKKLIGACIETYLLEKSRVVYQDKGERCYHIFYQLTHCHNNHPYLKLGPPEQFAYVNKSGCTELDDLRYPGKGADVEWNKELLHAFKTLLVSEEQMKSCFKKVAAILHMGNINFTQRAGEGSDIANPDEMGTTAELFEVDLKGLQGRLETRTVYLPGDKTIIKPLNVEDAIFNRDSMSRNLYNGLFRWIVWRINQQSAGDSEGGGISWIGILDVFGFEIFENNSFEQFCINFANERLQQYFNHHVLQAEQDLYKREALLWDPIDLPNNQDCIDLVMSKPYGILPILDSTCVQPKGDDNVFVANLFNAHKYHPRLRRAKSRKVSGSKQMENFNGFSIRHYAGEVIYNCANFLTKNSDSSEWDTVALFAGSKNEITSKMLRMMADGKMEEGALQRNQKRAFLSTGSVFADQLSMLMNELKKTAPYFVRCIKPNPNKEPKTFIQEFVRPQLRCGGLIEALRIIKLGFPTRCAYTRVYELFGSVLKDKNVVNLNLRDFTEAIMTTLGNQDEKLAKSEYQLGLTMVFFRPGKQEYLTNILDKSADQVPKEKIKEIRKFLIHKRWVRCRGTVKAWLRTGQMLQEMRFKKAAITMVIIYRAIGRSVIQARSVLGGKLEEELALRRARDLEYQMALAARQELAKLQELKKQQDALVAKLQTEHQALMQQKDEEMAAQQAKLDEAKKNVRDLQQKIQEAETKRLATTNENKAKIGDLEAKLAAETDAVNSLKRDQQLWQEKAEGYEVAVEKSRNANDDLRRQMGAGSAAYEKQIADKERLLGDLRERARGLEEQMRATKEQMDTSIRDLTEQLEQARTDARTEQDRLEGMVRERDSQISRLQSELTLLKSGTEQKIKDQEAQLEDVRQETQNVREKLSKQIAGKEGELDVARRDLADAQAKLEASNAAMQEAEKRVETQQEESLARLAELKEKYDREIRKLEGKIADQKAEIVIANDRVENAKRELAANQTGSAEKILQLDKQLKDKQQEAGELSEELKKTQSKLDELQRTLGDKISKLQDDLGKERTKARELATKFEKENWERNNEIQTTRSEIGLMRDRVRLAQELADAAAKSNQDTLAQERELTAQRVAKLAAELSARSDDVRELKSDYRNEKQTWKKKADKYEKTIADLEKQIDALHESAHQDVAKRSTVGKEAQQATANALARAAKLEAKYQGELEELRGEYKKVEVGLATARAERQKALQDREQDREGFNEREQKYKDDIAKLKADIDRVERDFISFKQAASDEVEQKISALQNQVALSQGLVDELKADKIENREREIALQDQLKEAVTQSAEARAALKSLQGNHGAEVEKLRVALEALKEKTTADSQQAKDHAEAQSRKIAEREAKITELKGKVQELGIADAKAKEELRKQQEDVKQQMLSLSVRNQELETERKVSHRKQIEYEQKVSDLGSKLGEASIALSEVGHKKKIGGNSKTEVEVLKAKLATAEKNLSDKNKGYDRKTKMLMDEAKSERDALESEYKRQLKAREEQAKAQSEAHKYKLQFLEASQKDIKGERKKWQEKEKELEKTLIALTGELRELRTEHTQAVEMHEAYRAHTEAKEAARAAEASNWEIKRQTLAAEHQLALRQVEAEKASRIAQLERELSKVKDELNDAMEEIENLSAELGGGGGGGGRAHQSYQPEPVVEAPKPSRSYTASPVASPKAAPLVEATPAAEAAPSLEPQAEGHVEEGQF